MTAARKLIAGASYGGDTLRMIGRAFDDAWGEVAQNYASPRATEAARLKLANIILILAAEGERDPAKLKDRAVTRFASMSPEWRCSLRWYDAWI